MRVRGDTRSRLYEYPLELVRNKTSDHKIGGRSNWPITSSLGPSPLFGILIDYTIGTPKEGTPKEHSRPSQG
jgi:hypothetical protein